MQGARIQNVLQDMRKAKDQRSPFERKVKLQAGRRFGDGANPYTVYPMNPYDFVWALFVSKNRWGGLNLLKSGFWTYSHIASWHLSAAGVRDLFVKTLSGRPWFFLMALRVFPDKTKTNKGRVSKAKQYLVHIDTTPFKALGFCGTWRLSWPPRRLEVASTQACL